MSVDPRLPVYGETREPEGAQREVPQCHDGVCITCSDEAVEVTVVALLDDDLARVDTGQGLEEVSVLLVDAGVGDRVLVHAGEAIGVVSDDDG